RKKVALAHVGELHPKRGAADGAHRESRDFRPHVGGQPWSQRKAPVDSEVFGAGLEKGERTGERDVPTDSAVDAELPAIEESARDVLGHRGELSRAPIADEIAGRGEEAAQLGAAAQLVVTAAKSDSEVHRLGAL